MWLSYILTGVGANLVSWLVLPRNAVSVGASGAVFGLFTISVLVKVLQIQNTLILSYWWKINPCKFINPIVYVDVLGLAEDSWGAYIGPICYRKGEHLLFSWKINSKSLTIKMLFLQKTRYASCSLIYIRWLHIRYKIWKNKKKTVRDKV